MKIYKTLIRPVVAYRGVTWTLAKWKQETLRMFQKKLVTHTYGLVKKDDEWRVRNNHEIDELLKQVDIIRFVKAQRI